MRAGIVSRTDNDGSVELTREIIAYLEEQGFDVSVETDTALALELQNHNTNLQDLDGDLIITVGGDGTILRTSMEMKDPQTPLFGVNMGRRGFLAEIQPYEYKEAIQSYLRGEYTVEENLKVRSWGLNVDDVFPDALNELLVACSLPSKMLLTRLSVDDEHITDIQADGIIFSTPAGSTAYNMWKHCLQYVRRGRNSCTNGTRIQPHRDLPVQLLQQHSGPAGVNDPHRAVEAQEQRCGHIGWQALYPVETQERHRGNGKREQGQLYQVQTVLHAHQTSHIPP
jgi:hypothetical protein